MWLQSYFKASCFAEVLIIPRDVTELQTPTWAHSTNCSWKCTLVNYMVFWENTGWRVELEVLRSLNGFQASVTGNYKAQSAHTCKAQGGDRHAFTNLILPT